MYFLAFFIEFYENLIDLRVLAIFCLADKLSLSHAPPLPPCTQAQLNSMASQPWLINCLIDVIDHDQQSYMQHELPLIVINIIP